MKFFTRVVVSLVALATASLGTSAHAALSPLGIAILPPVQFPPSDFSVTGARVSAIWGSHRDVYGFDFSAIGNITQQNFVGLGVSGLFNYNGGTSTILGLQAAGLANVNVNLSRTVGLMISPGVNINRAESSIVGLSIAGLANLTPFTSVYGVQAGIFNKSRRVYGFQIGVVNMVEELHGLQIGLLNFNAKGIFAVAPFLNVGF